MNPSCINHPTGESLLVLRKWHQDCCDGDMCGAAIIGYFQMVHIGAVPKLPINAVSSVVNGVMGLYQHTAVYTSLKRLTEIGLLMESTISDLESVGHCKSKTPSSLSLGSLQCEWCKSKTVTLQNHHYPVRQRDGGIDTVSICASCHSEFHYLSEALFYSPSEKLLELFEADPLSLEDVL